MLQGSGSVLSSALEIWERQGEDDSVVVLAGVQPIRQADWQCSLVVKQRSLTHGHTLQIGDKTVAENNVCPNMMHNPLHFFCVFVCVLLAPPFSRDIARRNKAPLYMLWRKHYKPTQKPLCLQAWGGRGVGGRGVWQAQRCLNLAWTLISTNPPSPSLSRPAACTLTLNIQGHSSLIVLNIL